MSNWHGLSIQHALLHCEIVAESRMTDAGPGDWYMLKLGDRVIPLGIDKHFADMLKFALVRNAEQFEKPPPAWLSYPLDTNPRAPEAVDRTHPNHAGRKSDAG